jgi:hypothetical protein
MGAQWTSRGPQDLARELRGLRCSAVSPARFPGLNDPTTHPSGFADRAGRDRFSGRCGVPLSGLLSCPSFDVLAPIGFRHKGASRFSAYWRQCVFGVMGLAGFRRKLHRVRSVKARRSTLCAVDQAKRAHHHFYRGRASQEPRGKLSLFHPQARREHLLAADESCRLQEHIGVDARHCSFLPLVHCPHAAVRLSLGQL